jgi:hypothetical protein
VNWIYGYGVVMLFHLVWDVGTYTLEELATPIFCPSEMVRMFL